MQRQLFLNLTYNEANGSTDFIIADPNRLAVEKLQNYQQWQEPGIIIFGPEGCGKSTLAHLWGSRVAAMEINDKNDITDYLSADCLQPVIIDNADIFVKNSVCAEPLFHLYQRLVANGAKMVLLAKAPAQQWHIDLPDIASRLRALPQIEITSPNDALTEMLLVKYFTERGITADPEIVEYLLPRVPRTAAALRALVTDLDKDALETQKRLTLAGIRAWAKDRGI